MTEPDELAKELEELWIKNEISYYDHDDGNCVDWKKLARHVRKLILSELKIVKKIPGKELYLVDRIAQIEAELKNE